MVMAPNNILDLTQFHAFLNEEFINTFLHAHAGKGLHPGSNGWGEVLDVDTAAEVEEEFAA